MDTAPMPLIGKRSVSKVRRTFLHRTADENEPETVDSAAKYITNNDVWIIATTLLNSKKDKKISTSIQFLNSHYNVSSMTVGNHSRSKVVTLNLKVNQRNINMPWEYMTQKLETYGDLELLNMIKDFAKLHAGFTKAISINFGLLPTDDPQSEVEIRKIKARAIKARREIENTYSYNKCEYYISKGHLSLLSLSYSEGMLKKLGYTLDSFPCWSKTNGIPAVFESEDQGYKEVLAKRFSKIFGEAILNSENIDLGPEFIVPLYRKDGCRKEAGVRFVSVMDPLPEGMFVTGYTIVKSKKKDTENENQKEDFKAETDMDSDDCVKKTFKKELSINICDQKTV